MTGPDGRPSEQAGTPPGGKRVVMVAAVAENGVIGRDGGMPWHLPGELAHFRRTTTGHSVVMGRVTYEGIGRPLPDRANIVVTRQPGWSADGVLVADSVEAAIRLAEGLDGDIMIGGGTQIYAQAMRFATHQVLTEVHQSPEGDTYYPHWDRTQWRETGREEGEGYSVVRYARDSLSP